MNRHSDHSSIVASENSQPPTTQHPPTSVLPQLAPPLLALFSKKAPVDSALRQQKRAKNKGTGVQTPRGNQSRALLSSSSSPPINNQRRHNRGCVKVDISLFSASNTLSILRGRRNTKEPPDVSQNTHISLLELSLNCDEIPVQSRSVCRPTDEVYTQSPLDP